MSGVKLPATHQLSGSIRKQARTANDLASRCRDLEKLALNQMQEIKAYRRKVAVLKKEIAELKKK